MDEKRWEKFSKKLSCVWADIEKEVEEYNKTRINWEKFHNEYEKSIKEYNKTKSKNNLESAEKAAKNMVSLLGKIENGKIVYDEYKGFRRIADPFFTELKKLKEIVDDEIKYDKEHKVLVNIPPLKAISVACSGSKIEKISKKLRLAFKTTIAFCAVNRASFLAKSKDWFKAKIKLLSVLETLGNDKNKFVVSEYKKTVEGIFKYLKELKEKSKN